MKIALCEDCGPLPVNHFHNWLESLFFVSLENFLGNIIPAKIYYFIDSAIYRLLIRLGLFKRTPEIDYSRASLRTTVFLDEAGKRGWERYCLVSAFGQINNFEIRNAGNSLFFEGLPLAEHRGNKISQIIDDKAKVKSLLSKYNFPAIRGRAFWWFQKNYAVRWAEKNLKFPLVVKPRLGSISHHLTINISNPEDLKPAIEKANRYSPFFIVEEFLKDVVTYRVTAVDYSNLACVKRVPAHVIGNGKNTLAELIAIKNQDSRRGEPKQKDTTLYKLVIDETSEKLVRAQSYGFDSVPESGKIVFLQEKVILDLGADLFEETGKMHPDNRKLFEELARRFGARLVGIDFLISDISLSWKSAPCAVLELNSLPYIDMHHFPTEGTPVNVAALVCDLVEKHYF